MLTKDKYFLWIRLRF